AYARCQNKPWFVFATENSEWRVMSGRRWLTTSMLFYATAAAVCFALFAACAREKTPDDVSVQQPGVAMTPMAGRSNGGAPAQTADDGQWVMAAKNFASTRFS